MTNDPTQRSLFEREEYIEEHRQAIEDLKAQPKLLPTTDNIFDILVDQNMQRYHEGAINILESGVNLALTVDSLSEEELLEEMRSQGWFVCSRSSRRKKKQ